LPQTPRSAASHPETAFRPFQGWPTGGCRRVGSGRPQCNFRESMATPYHTPMESPHLEKRSSHLTQAFVVGFVQLFKTSEMFSRWRARGTRATATRNGSKLRLILNSLFWAMPGNQSTPCGRPSLDRPSGRYWDGRPLSIITVYLMILNLVLLV
jgi:hypothetical protein